MVELLKNILVLIGVMGGLWKLIEGALKFIPTKKLQKAETENLNVTTQKEIISDLIKWSETLEERLKKSIQEFEENRTELLSIIEKLKDRIKDLEHKNNKMKRENKELLLQLSEFKNRKNE